MGAAPALAGGPCMVGPMGHAWWAMHGGACMGARVAPFKVRLCSAVHVLTSGIVPLIEYRLYIRSDVSMDMLANTSRGSVPPMLFDEKSNDRRAVSSPQALGMADPSAPAVQLLPP